MSIRHCLRIKTVVGNFARYLIDEHGVLRRNPARSVFVPPQPRYAPRVLDPDQRSVLRSLVERDGSPRSTAIVALDCWAGCRVSGSAHLRMEHTHNDGVTRGLPRRRDPSAGRAIPSGSRAIWEVIERYPAVTV